MLIMLYIVIDAIASTPILLVYWYVGGYLCIIRRDRLVLSPRFDRGIP